MPTIARAQLRWSPFRDRAGLSLPARATMASPEEQNLHERRMRSLHFKRIRKTQAVKNRTQLSKRGRTHANQALCSIFSFCVQLRSNVATCIRAKGDRDCTGGFSSLRRGGQ